MNGHGSALARRTEPGLQPVPNTSPPAVLSLQVLHLFDVFQRAGHELYLVGGCVRDHVLKLDAIGDLDFATSARPDDTQRVLRDAGLPTFPIGARFGTIATIVDGVQVEITTYRSAEAYPEDGRHPEVTFGNDLVEDLGRRDLSMNAMAMDAAATIVDPYDGRGAIERGILEVPGGGLDNTVSILRDDPLRLLRIARFAARFGYRPTDDTTAAARATADRLADISRERWKQETDKLLVARHVDDGVRWLADVGALGVLFPELERADETVIDIVASHLRSADGDHAVAWAVLLFDATSVAATGHAVSAGTDPGTTSEERAQRGAALAVDFRMSNAEKKALMTLSLLELGAPAWHRSWSDAELRRFVDTFGEHADDALALYGALGGDQHRALAVARRNELDALREREDPVPRVPSGLGRALHRRLDVPKGPEIGRWIHAVREAMLDGDLPTDATFGACVDWIRERLA